MNMLFILLDSRQSTPNSTADPLLSGRYEQLELATPVPVIPVQCDTLNMDSMEHHTPGNTHA